MHAQLLPRLRCPASGGPLRFEGRLQEWIDHGTLIGIDSDVRYPIKHGMPYLYVNDDTWQPKAREANGWAQLFKDTGGYDRDDGDFQWPYYDEQPWIDVARQFDIALELANPEPGDWVMDLGAGRGWAAKQFALRGCHAVAVDVVDDPQIGLGRSHALMAQAGVQYDMLIADGENLPFADNSFDLVFCAATLHHATNLPQLFGNAARVLRPRGRLVAIHEPCIADATNDEDLFQSPDIVREIAYGINETRPRLDEYRQAIRRGGLQETALFSWLTYGMELHHMASWSAELNILPPAQLKLPKRMVMDGLVRHYFGRDASAWEAERRRHLWSDYLLRERGGTIVLIATK